MRHQPREMNTFANLIVTVQNYSNMHIFSLKIHHNSIAFFTIELYFLLHKSKNIDVSTNPPLII